MWSGNTFWRCCVIPAATNCAPPNCSGLAVFRSIAKPSDSASILTHYRLRARGWKMESKREKNQRECNRPVTLGETGFEWFRSLALLVVFSLFSLPSVTGHSVNTHAEVKVTAKVELLNSRVKARNGKIDASDVVVWLESIDGDSPRGPRTPQKILQIGKRFKPHVMAVERGTEVY